MLEKQSDREGSLWKLDAIEHVLLVALGSAFGFMVGLYFWPIWFFPSILGAIATMYAFHFTGEAMIGGLKRFVSLTQRETSHR